MALLHLLAAVVELESPASDGWDVRIEDDRQGARVFLVLVHEFPPEVERGLACLRAVLDARRARSDGMIQES